MWWGTSKDNSRAYFNLRNFGAKYLQFKNELFTYYELQWGLYWMDFWCLLTFVYAFGRLWYNTIRICCGEAWIKRRMFDAYDLFRGGQNGTNRCVIRYESAYWWLCKTHVLDNITNHLGHMLCRVGFIFMEPSDIIDGTEPCYTVKYGSIKVWNVYVRYHFSSSWFSRFMNRHLSWVRHREWPYLIIKSLSPCFKYPSSWFF